MELESMFDIILKRHQKKYELNSTDGHEILYKDFLKDDFEVSVIFLAIMTISISVGLIGNILVIGGVSVYRKLRTTGNVFIVNLAVADLIVVTVIQPFNMIGIIVGPRFFHGKLEALCHMVSTICVMSCACSMMTLAVIAHNRYIFVCKNLRYKTLYSKKKIMIYIILIWLIGGLADLPNYLNWGEHTFDYETMSCFFDRHVLKYMLFISIVEYWIPLTFVVVCYTLIYIYVRKQRNQFRNQMAKCSSANEYVLSIRQHQDLRMIRTFVLVVVIFVLCWVPYFLLALFDRDENVPKIGYVLTLAIGHCNSSINSILYCATNKRFRIGYKMFIWNHCCKWFVPDDNKETNSTGNTVSTNT